MSKIYIVESEWWYDGCPDDYYNCSENVIEKIFDSDTKAVAYIQEKIKEILDNATEWDRDEYIDEVPSMDVIKEGESVIYRSCHNEYNAYCYKSHEVE
jgi:hypothetical protein